MTNNNLTHESCIARRSVLATIGLSTAGLAGCTSDSDSETSNNSSEDGSGLDTEDSDVFANVEMNDKKLEVEVTGESSTEAIALYDPDGDILDHNKLEDDDTEVAFEILGRFEDDIATGEYELAALESSESENSIDSTTITLEAECTITDVLWAAENPEMGWEKRSSAWKSHAAVVIENKGTIPSLLTELEWAGAPVARLLSKDAQSYYHEVRLPPGETTVYSEGPVYRTENSIQSLDCGDYGTESMTVTAVTQVGPDPSYTQEIEYGDGQSCELSIVEESLGESTSGGGEN